MRRRRSQRRVGRSVTGIALWCTGVAAGCGGSLAPVQQASPSSFALCQAAAGTTLYEVTSHQGISPSLVSANGNLYFALGTFTSSSSNATANIVSLPTTGGTPVPVAAGDAYQMWLAGQAIDFAGLDDKLWQVPLTGGDATLLADGMTTGPPNYFVAAAQAFDGTNFYWTLQPQSGTPFWNVWQIPATGGAAQKLADLPMPAESSGNWTMLSASAQGVLVAYDAFPQVGAYLVPPGGGTPQVLPSPPPVGSDADNELLATSPTAVLWSTESVDPTTGANIITLSLTDLTAPGGPVIGSFWPNRPASFSPSSIYSWSGGDDGSWLISGNELFDDGTDHTTLWLVDPEGNGARVGCDPAVGDGPAIVIAAVATPTAIYAVVESNINDAGTSYLRIVQLGR